MTVTKAPLWGGPSSSAILNLSQLEDVYSKRFSSEMKSLQLRVKLKFCVFPASRWILCSLIHGVQSICPYTEIKEAKASFQFPLYCTCRLLLFQTVSCFLYKLFCPWNSASFLDVFSWLFTLFFQKVIKQTCFKMSSSFCKLGSHSSYFFQY